MTTPGRAGDHDPEVHVAVRGRTGFLTLNRPAAINSLTIGMIDLIQDALTAWVDDPNVAQVVLHGAGERGLCAGADLRAMRASALAADGSGQEFFRREYRLNATIARYPKPYLAVMDGITMGGGIGLSAHGSVRVVTERSRLAMPEVTIGLVPDVGGTWLLSHAPGQTGTYLGLTAEAVGPGDAIAMGLADHMVDSARLAELLDRITDEPSDAVLRDFADEAPEAPLVARRSWIDASFAGDDVDAILAALDGTGLPEAQTAAATIRTKSPTAVAVTLASLRIARHLDSLEEALEQEFRVCCACLEHPDLAEGIRALIVDKDGSPQWSPNRSDAVDQATVTSFLTNTGDGSLGLVP